MPIDNSQIEDLPDWAVAESRSAVNQLLSFWNENSETAYTQDELAEETDLSIQKVINIIVELRHSDVITKKGVYLRPTNIEEAYETWEEINEDLQK